MTKQEARIILLEKELIQSYHTITFLDQCLKGEAKYAYPEMTVGRLRTIARLVGPIKRGCIHSNFHADCQECIDLLAWRSRVYEAQECLQN